MTREQFIRNIEDSQGSLRRFLTVVCCGDSAMADDIAQEAYIKAYLSLDKFREGESFAAWMRRIAYNEFVDQQRHARASSPLDAAAQTASDSASDTAFDYEQLYAAMSALSPRERSVVTLFYFDGYSSREIADIAGLSDDNVRKTLQRGRERLRFLIEKI